MICVVCKNTSLYHSADNRHAPWVCDNCRAKAAMFDELVQFVKDSNCECLDEYGTPAPQKCDRCTLLEKTSGG